MADRFKELRKQGRQFDAIRSGRGILKRKVGDQPLTTEWVQHKTVERTLEGRRQKPAK